MPTKVAEAYVAIRANTARLMGDLQTARGATVGTAGQMGAAFPAGVGPGVAAASGQIQGLPVAATRSSGMLSRIARTMGLSFPAGIGPGVAAAKAQIATLPIAAAKAGAASRAATAGLGGGMIGFAKSMAGAMGAMAVGAGFVSGAKKAIEFDSAMIEATTAMNVAGKAADELAMKARDVGVAWGVGATKASEAMGFLGVAGFTAEESMAGMDKVVQLGIAGNMDAAIASDILTDSISALGFGALKGEAKIKKMVEIGDQLAAGSVTANTSVQELGEAILNKAGAAAAGVRMPMSELNTMLLILADKGKKGATAGILAATAIEGLGQAAAKYPGGRLNKVMFDSRGEIRPMVDLIDELTAAYGHMKPEQRMAAFLQDGISRQSKNAVNMLIESGAKAREYGGALAEAGGEMERMANKKMQSLANQLKRLTAMFEDLSISVIGPMVGALIDLVDPIAKAAMWLGRWSEAHNDLLPRIAGVVAGVGALQIGLPFLAAKILMVSKVFTKALMSNPWTALLTALAMFVFTLYDAQKAGEKWAKPFVSAGQKVWDKLQQLWEKVKELGTQLGDVLLPIWESIKAKALSVVDVIMQKLTQFTDMMDSNVSGTRTGWQTAWEVIQNVAQLGMAFITATFETIHGAWILLTESMGAVWKTLFGATFTTSVTGAWTAFANWIGDILDLLSVLTADWNLTWKLIKEISHMWLTQIWDFIASGFEYASIGALAFLGAVTGVFKGIYNASKFYMQSAWAYVKATFNGMIAVADEAWAAITGQGSGEGLGEAFQSEFDRTMKETMPDEGQAFGDTVGKEIDKWTQPAVADVEAAKAARAQKIRDSQARQAEIMGDMERARNRKRNIEDEANARKKAEDDVADAQDAAADADGKGGAVKAAPTKIVPEIGFKGIQEFGRSLQQALLKDDDKARDDKQAKDINKMAGLLETNNEIAEQQLEAAQANTGGGLVAPQ